MQDLIAPRHAPRPVLLRYPPGLRDRVKAAAAAAGQSENTWLVAAIVYQLERKGEIEQIKDRLTKLERNRNV